MNLTVDSSRTFRMEFIRELFILRTLLMAHESEFDPGRQFPGTRLAGPVSIGDLTTVRSDLPGALLLALAALLVS